MNVELELWMAIQHDDHDLSRVVQLLSLGANPNATLPTGESAFRIACANDSYKIAEVLIKAGARLEELPSDWLVRPFFMAISRHDLDQTKRLLVLGAKPDAILSTGESAIESAVVFEAYDIAELLLSAGANPWNYKNESPQSRCLRRVKNSCVPEATKVQALSLANKISSVSQTTASAINTTAGLEELKAIFNRSYLDGRVFTQEVQSVGYRFKEQAPWGSAVVMERGDDKFIIDIQNGGVRELIYRCERLNLSVSLVVEGKKAF